MKKLIIILLLLLLLFPGQAIADPRPKPIYDIPMSAPLQNIVKNLCKEHSLSFELVLGVIYVESRFNIMADSGCSKGLMQLNVNTYPTLAKELGIENFNPFYSVHNVTAGIYYLARLRDKWKAEGYTDEEVFSLVLLSYNMGEGGCRKYIKKHGLWSSYIDKVYNFKCKLEQQNICSS